MSLLLSPLLQSHRHLCSTNRSGLEIIRIIFRYHVKSLRIRLEAPTCQVDAKALESCQLALGRSLPKNRSLRQKVSEFEATAISKRRLGDEGDNCLGYKKNAGPVTAALFNVIPKKYHSLLDYAEYKHLGKDFIAEPGNYRSSMLNTLRRVIASILTSAGYTINSQILASTTADTSQDKVLLGLLRFPNDKLSKLFAPIDGKKNMMYIFLSRIVLDLHRVMVHGPSSLAANSKPDPKANGTKYGFVEVTDHSLALASTFARFLVSADKTFASIGPIMKINWQCAACALATRFNFLNSQTLPRLSSAVARYAPFDGHLRQSGQPSFTLRQSMEPMVQPRQSRFKLVPRIRVILPLASLLPHRRPTTSASGVGRIVWLSFKCKYGASAHGLHSNFVPRRANRPYPTCWRTGSAAATTQSKASSEPIVPVEPASQTYPNPQSLSA
ncbi:hypothetical protein B0H14DRAFT_3177791, partial [Mycena olivaceomarginata]